MVGAWGGRDLGSIYIPYHSPHLNLCIFLFSKASSQIWAAQRITGTRQCKSWIWALRVMGGWNLYHRDTVRLTRHSNNSQYSWDILKTTPKKCDTIVALLLKGYGMLPLPTDLYMTVVGISMFFYIIRFFILTKKWGFVVWIRKYRYISNRNL